MNFQIVPYRGTPDVIVALLRNDIQLMIDFYAPMKPTLLEQKIRPLATSGAARSPFFSDVPTVAQAGVPGYEVPSWNGLFAPAGTPPEIIGLLNRSIREIVEIPEVKQRYAELGIEAKASSPEELKAQARGRHQEVGGTDRARRHREALTISNSGRDRAFPRRNAPRLCLGSPETEGEWSADRRSGACEAPARWTVTRPTKALARRLCVPCDRDARLSALHCGDFGPGAALPSRALPPDQLSDAPRSRVVMPGGRGPGPPGIRLRAGPQDADPRSILWHVSGRRPSLSKDGQITISNAKRSQ